MRGQTLWAAFLLLTCTADCTPLYFRTDQAFSPEETAAIQQAAADWNAVTNAKHKITFQDGGWYIVKADLGNGWGGLTTRSKHLIQIIPLPRPELVRIVAKHEFGHALGLRHLCGGPQFHGDLVPGAGQCGGEIALGVMDPGHSSETLTEADMAECRAVGACD